MWSFLFKPRRISVSLHKARNDYKRISGRYFQTRYRFFIGLLMLKELLGIFEISVGNFMRNGCHVGLVGLIRRGLKQNSTLA